MNESNSAWLALIEVQSLFVNGSFDPDMKKVSKKAKDILLISIIDPFSCLIMVLKGFHLWGTWENLIN